MTPPPINAEDALTYCRLILRDEPTEYRLIHPVTGGARHHWGFPENEEQLGMLADWNAEGFGVYAVVNRCDPSVEQRIKGTKGERSKGARDEDVTGVRAVFIDFDTGTAEENHAKLAASPLAPSMTVCSGLPAKLHAYWVMADLPVEDFRRVQKALAEHFGSDQKIVNEARVMRLPGFVNTKPEYAPDAPLASVLMAPGHVYTRAELFAVFNIPSEPPAPPARAAATVRPPADDRARRYALSALDREAQAVRAASEGNRNDQLNRSAFSLGRLVGGGALDRAVVEGVLRDAAAAAGLAGHEIEGTLRSGIEAGILEPRGAPERPEREHSRAAAAPAADAEASDLRTAALEALAAAKARLTRTPGAEQTATVQEALEALAASLPSPLTADLHLREISAATGMTLGMLRDAYKEVLSRAEDGQASGERKSTATELIEQALAQYDLKVSDTGEPFAVPKADPRVPLLLRGGQSSLRAGLARDYFKANERAAPQQALADAMGTLDGFAQEADPVPLHQRVAKQGNTLWLDLGDATGRAVKITESGWSTETNPPVYFRRTSLTLPLPEPVRGADLNDLWKYVNVAPEDRPLYLAWNVAALDPTVPHTILSFSGGQGSGKSSATRATALLLDPSPVPLRKPPKDSDTWITAASGSWVTPLDNLSSVNDWLSDTLCRAVTGEGDVRRRLYSDADLAVFAFRRAVIITGIDLGGVPGDLADRLLPITLHEIEPHQRREEAEMWADWHGAHPRLLGALLDFAQRVITLSPSVAPFEKPRMADYARTLAAVDQLLGTNGLERYLGAQSRLALDTLTGDPFTVELMARVTLPFDGTSAELLDLIDGDSEKRRPKGWPKTARAVTQRLRRQAPVLRKAGWLATEDGGHNKAGTVTWSLLPPPRDTNKDDPPNPPGPLPRSAREELGGASAKTENAITRLTRHDPPSPKVDNPPDPPTTPMTRLDDADADERTGLAGQAGHHSATLYPSGLEDILRRAANLAERYSKLGIEKLRAKYQAATERATAAPTWWATTAKTESLAVTIALEMLATDQAAGAFTGTTNPYLQAARHAVAALKSHATTPSTLTPPAGAPT